MAFSVAQPTLDSLEWTRLVDELRASCRTPQGRLLVAPGEEAALFEAGEADVRTRLAETSEARALIDADAVPPLGGCRTLEAGLARASKGGTLEASELLDVARTLEALHASLRFFEHHREAAPSLAEPAAGSEPLVPLEREIDRCLDGAGEVRDAASTALAEARRDVHRLSSELQRRIERALAHPDVAPHLSDSFYTVRSGRFVLPVKADAKGRVRGIVHDASRSGTTIFVEPEGMIESNNRHKQAELAIEHETRRVLRALSRQVAAEAPTLSANLEIIARIDLAVARGLLSRQMRGVEPRVADEGIFELPGLRHPSIPADECVANDLRLGRDFSALILSGPNAGGKTVALKAIALAALCVRAGLHIAADPGARVDLVEGVLADIGDHQDIQESLSTFSAAMASLAETLREARPGVLVCLDEIGVGTDPSEGAAIAQSALEALASSGALVVTTTHYNLLKEMAEVDERFENACVEFDPVTLAPTYRVRIGTPGASSATTVAARMGMPRGVLERAGALLEHDDRRLDRMLSELAASRALLESEQSAARRLRDEGEQAREQYLQKLARLQERRDKLYSEMRRDLDDSFRTAHSEVARIIAELQRAPSSKGAAGARSELETLRERTQRDQVERGLSPEPAQESSKPGTRPIDWPHARPGDPVIAPAGRPGVLLSLPDRRGRVSVRVGPARLQLAREQLSAPETSGAIREAIGPRVDRDPDRAPAAIVLGGSQEIDLRGLRVDEALERLDGALDRAATEGRDELRVIHGIGTGALRRAVREHLPDSPYVVECLEAERDEGGAGATRAILRKE
jgi:DNA mismatch repair protein MutS2